jgi:hypothetical protein
MGGARRNPSKRRDGDRSQKQNVLKFLHENLLTLVFPEIPDYFEPVAPIPAVFPLRHIFVKGGMGPIRGAGYKPVLHRIIMNVVKMAPQILFIPNGMLPKSPLPDTPLTFCDPAV